MNKRTRENVARFIITHVIPDTIDYRKRLWSVYVRGGVNTHARFHACILC